MAITFTPRLGIRRWGASTDPFTRAQVDADNAKLDSVVVMFSEGNLADRPAAGVNGRIYDAQDVGLVYYDTGAAWVALTEPAGIIKQVAGTTAPVGTTAADGRVVDRVGTYARAFAYFGTTHNTGGETASQFRLPDYRDVVLVGASATKPVGWKGGAETHTITVAQLPSHAHPGSTASSAGGHSHTASSSSAGSHDHSSSMGGAGQHSHGGSTGTESTAHYHTPFGGAGGYFLHTGGAAGNGVTRWYKTTDGTDPTRYAVQEGTSTNTENTSHYHGISADGQHAHTLTINANGAHTHPITVDAVAAHTHTITVAAQGGGSPIPLMQPSAAVLTVITI